MNHRITVVTAALIAYVLGLAVAATQVPFLPTVGLVYLVIVLGILVILKGNTERDKAFQTVEVSPLDRVTRDRTLHGDLGSPILPPDFPTRGD